MQRFLDYTTKRKYYSECLSDLLNYLERHSESFKYNKLNNTNGIKSLLKCLIRNVDSFVQEGDDIELVLIEKEIKKVDEKCKEK